MPEPLAVAMLRGMAGTKVFEVGVLGHARVARDEMAHLLKEYRQRIAVIMIAEASPANAADYFYAGGDALFAQTTVQAFEDAGAQVSSVQDILDLGVYLNRIATSPCPWAML